MRNLIIIIATTIFIIAVLLQIICTMQYLSLSLFGFSAFLYMLVKEKQIFEKASECNGTCEHCVCKNSKDEQHNQT